ncbi:MAG TPA: carboxypeptidase-like regulatory domain-containing protein [Acidobacteriaceae bacterium]|nr:carboxypeptidase-like regulatory domain-containing protein [Acidobacteriaceae bacterium]
MRFPALFLSLLVAGSFALAQTAPAPAALTTTAAAAPAGAGGTIHGAVMAGKVPLPGVTVTAENTLTGEKYSTTTDITGTYALVIPQNGRYVLRTQLTAFAPVTKEALLNGASAARTVDFSLQLASRALEQQARQAAGAQLLGGAGAQNLDLLGSGSDLIQAGGGGGETGAELPSLAGNSNFSSGESVAVTGQNGVTNPFAGVDFSQMREDAQLNQSVSGSGPGGPVVTGPGGRGGGGFRGGGGGGGGFRFHGNFRNFKPNQPHGAIFWTGGNGALNADDFALRGQPIQQPAYASNRFGATLFAPPYIPKLLTHDTNDIVFLTLFGTRSSQPFDQYATVPTLAERGGDFSSLTTQNGTPIAIYDPAGSSCTADGNTPGQQFVGNKIPASCISPQAQALLNYVPEPNPNLPGTIQNYQRLASTETNTTNIGIRFMHTFGNSGGANPFLRMARQFLGVGTPGITQSIHANYNYQNSSSDDLNVFSALGGASQTRQNSLQLGYSIGKGRLTNNLNAGWNQTHSQVSNPFSNVQDVAASVVHLSGLPTSPQLWGLPNVTLNQFTGLNETQPRFELQETVSIGEMSMWMHGKHNLRLGADFRRVYQDQIGDTDSTGTFTFSGLFTEMPGSSETGNLGSSGASGLPSSGSSLADLLLGLPQETTIQAANVEAHLRQNAIDWYAQDDWRAGRNLTILYGLRYEYFSPYSEEHDRLATLDVSSDFSHAAVVTPNGVGSFTGKFPHDLVYPEKNNFEPRLGIALHPMHDTVIRGGYGINYTVGQYVDFVQNFAFAPPFANVQDNTVYSAADEAGVVSCSSFCLASGFPVPESEQIGTWAVNKNYRLPYVQVWNVNLQRTIPWQVVLNVGYTGTKGSRLDVVDAPGRYPETVAGALTTTQPVAAANPALIVPYDYENSGAFSNYNALAASVGKRLTGVNGGIALRATYTYSHAIDDATSIGGNGGTTCGGTCLAQNWQNLRAEESNSSFDVRHNVTGNFLYELPFGPNTHLLTADWLGHALANMSFSGTFQFAAGNPLTPHYEDTAEGVTTGTTNSQRPDRVPGVSLTAGAGHLENWFNKPAFASPPATSVYGTASRLSIPGPGTVSVDMSASKSIRFGDFKTFEMRATANNVFNTVQYAGVDTTLGDLSYGQVNSTAQMRQFTFIGRFRF